ncbi:MAG TPA: hypothetical protein VGX27_14555 [Candidatus Dormibacteraeota bacterium]|nr:hypothetical protein [Candidatus Dormibacteraeota bacterium]
MGQVAGDDFSRTFLLLVEQGKSRPSKRVLDLIAKRTHRPVSFFLAQQEDTGGLPDRAPDLATEMVSVAARLRQIRLGGVRTNVDQEALKLLEVTVRQGAELVRAIETKHSGRAVELRIAGTRRERKKAS